MVQPLLTSQLRWTGLDCTRRIVILSVRLNLVLTLRTTSFSDLSIIQVRTDVLMVMHENNAV